MQGLSVPRSNRTPTLTLGTTLLSFTIMFFPNGGLPGPRWRWAVWALVVDASVTIVSSAIAVTPIELSPRLPSVPNPLAVPALDGFTSTNAPFSLVAFVSGVAIIVSAVVVRFRRSQGVERSQLRWFARSISCRSTHYQLMQVPEAVRQPHKGALNGQPEPPRVSRKRPPANQFGSDARSAQHTQLDLIRHSAQHTFAD
jgi:hypothetical protein